MTGSEKPMVSVSAGKFPVPLFAPGNSELLFDGDLSPEGVSEGITLWDHPSGFVRNLKITGLQWSIKEISNSSATQLFNPADGWDSGSVKSPIRGICASLTTGLTHKPTPFLQSSLTATSGETAARM